MYYLIGGQIYDRDLKKKINQKDDTIKLSLFKGENKNGKE